MAGTRQRKNAPLDEWAGAEGWCDPATDERRLIPGQLVRLGIAFALLFAAVFFFFWWSGSAVRFGASRVGDNPVPTWRVTGVVRDAVTGEPIPWAVVRDDPGGRPPFFRTEANHAGAFELLTLAEPHTVRFEAPGYRSGTVQVGRHWFIWWPRGDEAVKPTLIPE